MESWLDAVYDAEGMGEADRWAIEEANIPSLELMEAAGRGLARVAAEMAGTGPVTVVCGRGNNGGDGLVAARHLADSGFDVGVITFSGREGLSPDSQANLDRLPEGLVEVAGDSFGPDSLRGVVIDAMLGTGFEGEPRGPISGAIESINASGLSVLACDVPSGVNASTGEAAGLVVDADRTVTFHQRKLGHLISPGKQLCGPVEVVPIGIPQGAPSPRAGGAIKSTVLDLLPRREGDSNKFTSGRVSIVGGSRGLTGAVCLAAEAAVRAGAGYATAAVPGALEEIFEIKLTEVMTRSFGTGDSLGPGLVPEIIGHLEGAASVVLGSGIGRLDGVRELVAGLAAGIQASLVIDADALSATGTGLGPISSRRGATVLTPHDGEAGRLLGCDSSAVAAHRLATARQLATEAQAVVILKGDDSIVTDGERVAVNTLPAPALATAGTGDVLAGVVGAFLGRGLDAFDAASAAVFAHAVAGGIAAVNVGNRDGVIATDVIQALPQAMIPPAGG